MRFLSIYLGWTIIIFGGVHFFLNIKAIDIGGYLH